MILNAHAEHRLLLDGPKAVHAEYDGAYAIAFSPDSSLLIYTGPSLEGWESLFVVDLTDLTHPRQITNLGLRALPPPERLALAVPTPDRSRLTWVGHLITFKDASSDIVFTIDLDTGQVSRKPSPDAQD
jgi:hypothetical protein